MIWDNIALQHARSAVNPASRRTLRRVVANDHINDPEFIHRSRNIYLGKPEEREKAQVTAAQR